MFPFLAKFQTIIDKSQDLSDISKQQYKSRLKKLTDMTQHDIDWVIQHCEETLDFITKAGRDEPQTIKSYINAVLAVYRYTSGLRNKYKTSYKCWSDKRREVSSITNEKYDNLQASEKQIEVYIPWQEIIDTRDKLPRDSDAYLMLSLYTMIPPCRADFNNVRIVYNKEPIEQTNNYLFITKDYMKLVLNEFKSKSKSISSYENILPENLEKVIRDSLITKPRDYLVVSPRTGQPYQKAHSYTVYFDRLLHKTFGKNITINTLRHSFINSLDFNQITPTEKQRIANQMMHSISMMDRYRLFIPTAGKQKMCTIICDS
jgi:hypothetical protein